MTLRDDNRDNGVRRRREIRNHQTRRTPSQSPGLITAPKSVNRRSWHSSTFVMIDRSSRCTDFPSFFVHSFTQFQTRLSGSNTHTLTRTRTAHTHTFRTESGRHSRRNTMPRPVSELDGGGDGEQGRGENERKRHRRGPRRRTIL